VQGLERELLDLRLSVQGDLCGPSLLHLAQLSLLSEGESVLQGDTGGDTDVRGTVFVGQFLAESSEVGSEVDLRGVGELLLSIGTFRRICAKTTVSEGALE
jgi:hypothetical protein